MYGVGGWALLLGVFFVPVAAFSRAVPPHLWAMPNRAPAAALAGALAVVGADAARHRDRAAQPARL